MKKEQKKNIKKNIPVEAPNKTRRDFIKTAWKGLGIVAGLELTGLTLHYLVDRKDSVSKNDLFEVGLPDEFPNGTVTPFRRGHFFLVRMKDGGFLAMSLKCSHLGCSIIWEEKINEFVCPCHSSKFSIAGDVINPPAPRALDAYKIEITDGKLFINLNKKMKRDEFEKSQLTYI
jgi:cytochrome b6-f complex iron-sulfur subunit